MTLSEIRTDVKGRCAISDSTLDSLITAWVNNGLRNIIRRHTWEFLFVEATVTTVASTETYSLASDVMRIYTVRNTTSSSKVNPIRVLDFYKSYPNPTATGSPTLYRLSGLAQTSASSLPLYQVSLFPIPDAVYSLKYTYYKRVSDLSADADVPYIPVEYHELLCNYAASLFFTRIGDARSESENTKFENGLRDMSEALSSNVVEQIDGLELAGAGGIPPAPQFPPTFGRVNW